MDSEFYVIAYEMSTFLSEGAVKTNEHNSVLYWLIIERRTNMCANIHLLQFQRKEEKVKLQQIEIDSQRDANKSTTVIIMITSKGGEISC